MASKTSRSFGSVWGSCSSKRPATGALETGAEEGVPDGVEAQGLQDGGGHIAVELFGVVVVVPEHVAEEVGSLDGDALQQVGSDDVGAGCMVEGGEARVLVGEEAGDVEVGVDEAAGVLPRPASGLVVGTQSPVLDGVVDVVDARSQGEEVFEGLRVAEEDTEGGVEGVGGDVVVEVAGACQAGRAPGCGRGRAGS
ncbi:hypothetical protein ACQ4WX_04065 [Streptomyces lasalocidi]